MGKNIKKIQDMLMGTTERTVQVGFGDQEVEQKRKVGDKWTDSDGKKWEQKPYGRVSVGSVKVGIFRYQCKECKKNCVDRRDIDTFKRMDRCFHCQINFECDLKNIKIGENGNKWYFWVKLQMLRRWTSIDKRN